MRSILKCQFVVAFKIKALISNELDSLSTIPSSEDSWVMCNCNFCLWNNRKSDISRLCFFIILVEEVFRRHSFYAKGWSNGQGEMALNVAGIRVPSFWRHCQAEVSVDGFWAWWYFLQAYFSDIAQPMLIKIVFLQSLSSVLLHPFVSYFFIIICIWCVIFAATSLFLFHFFPKFFT